MKRIVLFAALAIVATTLSAAPTPECVQFIEEHVKWLNASKQNVVRATAVSNQNNRLASYAEGELTITGQPFPGTAAPTYLGGTLEQFFSDRKYDLPSSKGGVEIARYPFSPKATDKISLSLSSEGNVAFTLKSWNNTPIKLVHVRCSSGVLYGFTDNTSGPHSLYVISLAKGVKPGSVTLK